MRARTTAAVVIAGAVMVLTAGCNFISPQTTTEIYDASDGVNTTVGDIEVRNAIVFTENGDEASLSVVVINNGSSAANVKFQYQALGSTETAVIPVAANGETDRGTQGGQKQTILNGIGKQPGSLLTVFIQSGTDTGKKLNVPVLDGSLTQYATLLPSPSPSTGTIATSEPRSTEPTETETTPAG